MNKLLASAEYIFTVVALLHYSGGPLAVILSGGANEGEGGASADNSLILVLFFLIYIITFVLLVLRWKNVVFTLSKDRFIWVLTLLAIFSILWSVNPSKTIARCVALTGTNMFGLYLATRYTMKEQIKLFAWMFGIAIVLSFVFAIALNKYGVMGGLHAGKWRGIYTHKNVLGKEMAVSTIVFFLQALNVERKRWLMWIGFVLSLLLLLLSTATSSFINTIILLFSAVIFQIFRWDSQRLVPAFTFVATLGGSLYLGITSNAEAFLGSLGKSSDLTGRGDLWPLVIQKIWQKPWFGYGYSGFWHGLNGESSVIWYQSGWTPPNAHNGFLDLCLSLGFVGLAIFALAAFSTIGKAFVCLRLTKTSEWLWPLIYITYLILGNLAESTLMIQNDIFWVFFVAIAFSVLIPPEPETKKLQF